MSTPESVAFRKDAARMLASARERLAQRMTPQDAFERAVVNALGEISVEEAVAAIQRHRLRPEPEAGEPT